jgi:hypothetical protein
VKLSMIIATMLLVGCASEDRYYAPEARPDTYTGLPSMSSGSYNGVEWICGADEINDDLVWVRCNFHNVSISNREVCLRVGYKRPTELLTNDQSFVLSDRIGCSGMLDPDQRSENYFAFQKEARKRLDQVCGTGLKLCKLKAMVSK